MDELRGRVALVTGASRGIGKATAVALARAGCDVAINYRQAEDEAHDTAARIHADPLTEGRRTAIIQADVSQDADVKRLVQTAERELGPIGVLINNAGWAHRQEMDAIEEDDWDAVVSVNLKSVWLVTRAVLPGMRERGWGRIVNVSSGAAHTGGVVGLHYTASKGGVDALTRAYASRVVKEGILVNIVAPALIATDMMRNTEERRRMIPLGRLGEAEEVADAIVFTASNGYMTGQTIHLNGGLYYR